MSIKKRKLTEINSTIQSKELKVLQEENRILRQQIYALSAPDRKYKIKSRSSKFYRFAITSDWHIGSLYRNDEALIAFYEYAASQKIRDFFCAGDLIDGHNVYKGHAFELREVGFDRQMNALIDVTNQFPKTTRTHFITGNHDSSFTKQIGMLVGPQIESNCKNVSFVGADFGLVSISLPSADLRIALMHPDGGTAYALSYRAQKIIESWEGGQKPHIVGLGHFHKAEYMPRYRNVKAIQAGCFQNQTPFMIRKGLAAHVGGWIVEIAIGELYNQIRTEFVEFF